MQFSAHVVLVFICGLVSAVCRYQAYDILLHPHSKIPFYNGYDRHIVLWLFILKNTAYLFNTYRQASAAFQRFFAEGNLNEFYIQGYENQLHDSHVLKGIVSTQL